MNPTLKNNFQDCLAFFYSRNQFSIKLGLETMRALLDGLGNPDQGLRFLHVAGTNGKGSVCANLAGLLKATGYKRIGLYTSPHLVSFRERILIDGEPIPPEFIVDWMSNAKALILRLNATYFECVTALALCYFKAERCEAVVLETGLGGRLDASNVVIPAVTVITSISLDHTSILGDTVEKIWVEKIGILKPKVPMVVAEKRAHMLAVLAQKAVEVGSQVYTLHGPGNFAEQHPPMIDSQNENELIPYQGFYTTYPLPSALRIEKHQRENLALAILAMEVFLNGPLPSPEILAPILHSAKLPGRTQLLEQPPLLPLLLDGAHNLSGIEALRIHIQKTFPEHRVKTFFSIMGDKDYLAVYKQVEKFSDQIYFVALKEKFPRALDFSELQKQLSVESNAKLFLFPLLEEKLLPILEGEKKKDDELIVVCGSLYLLGEIIPFLIPYYSQLNWFKQFLDEF